MSASATRDVQRPIPIPNRPADAISPVEGHAVEPPTQRESAVGDGDFDWLYTKAARLVTALRSTWWRVLAAVVVATVLAAAGANDGVYRVALSLYLIAALDLIGSSIWYLLRFGWRRWRRHRTAGSP